MIGRVFAFFLLLASGAFAQDTARIVYLGLEEDGRYEPQPLYTGLSLRDRNRPLDGIRLGFRDTRVLGRAVGVTFELQEQLASAENLAETLRAAQGANPLVILLDLPPDAMELVLASARDDDLFINIRDGSDKWRGVDCKPMLMHTPPSDTMLTDALAQHLRAQRWTKILLLVGPSEADKQRAAAVRRSVAKFGLRIADERSFELTNDPRRRDRSNIALLTGGARYDVIWLVDDYGDFGRYMPYATYAARPVVGAEGLVPVAWHWTFERFGAPQLNQRFRRLAGRDMSSEDWAGWVAIRSIADAIAQTGTAKRETVREMLASSELSVDLYKGVRGNFRDWSGQLRQPILLARHNAVIAVAPIDGFEHRYDTLDTLGQDRQESNCQP